MKVGDRIRIISPDFCGHKHGDLGTIRKLYWASPEESMFGVELDDRDAVAVDGGLWAYSSEEMEVSNEQV